MARLALPCMNRALSIEKWIPSGPVLVNTSTIAITAASSPILANLLKGVIKNLIKRLQGKKKKVE